MAWSRALLSSTLLVACNAAAPTSPIEEPPAPEPRMAVAAVPEGPRPQPKPGERVRQPELDTYCIDDLRPVAFYYHGGAPVRRLARHDRCAPLFITECESSAHCYPPRDQEPGMWCCSAAEHSGAEVQQALR